MPLISRVGRQDPRVKMLVIGIAVFLWVGVAIHVFPVYYMLISSIKPYYEIYTFPPTFFPKQITFIAYKFFINIGRSGGYWGFLWHPFYIYLKNSIVMTGAIMAFQIPITAFAAYALSKLHSARISRILFLYFVGTMLIPYQISLIPTYLLLKNFPLALRTVATIPFTNVSLPTLNLLDTYWAVILPSVYSAFSVLLFKGYFDTIRDELINAARVDGASERKIFFRIILPMSRPVFAVVAYITFAGAWDSFLWPMIVLRRTELMPLTLMLYSAQANMIRPDNPAMKAYYDAGIGGWSMVMAMSLIQVIPLVVMFVVFREQIMKGIKLRGLK